MDNSSNSSKMQGKFTPRRGVSPLAGDLRPGSGPLQFCTLKMSGGVRGPLEQDVTHTHTHTHHLGIELYSWRIDIQSPISTLLHSPPSSLTPLPRHQLLNEKRGSPQMP